MNNFDFFFGNRLFAGIGIHKEIPSKIIERGHRAVLFIIDENVANMKPVQAVVNLSKAKGIQVEVYFARGSSEPDYDYLDLVVDQLKSIEVDLIIGIGGGSCLDLAKGVSVLRTNTGKGIDYRGFDKVKKPGIPLMLIPTTAGSGSEVTINAVFTDLKEQKKLGINGLYMNASYAVLDPEFTIDSPFKVAQSAGIDAVVHALEGFVNVRHTPLSRIFSREAFRLLYQNLPAIIDDRQNKERHLNIQLGAYLAAVGLFNSGSGIAGAISYPLGVHYKVPHGIGGGIFALSVVEYNIENNYYDYAELLDLIDSSGVSSINQKEKSLIFLKKLKEFYKLMQIPKSLTSFGISNSEKEKICGYLQSMQPAFDQNPISLNVSDINKIMDSHF